MTFDEILDLWTVDSELDITDLAEESRKSVSLHAKYKRFYVAEKLKSLKWETDLKKLKNEKYEYYTKGSTNETTARGWPILTGTIIKTMGMDYVNSDQDVIKMVLKVSAQDELVDLLSSILKEISNRSFHITNAREFLKWSSGG